jgi:HSP20 family protein
MALLSRSRSRRAGGELLPSHDIWEPFGWLRRDMDRVFEDFWRDFGWGQAAQPGMAVSPRIDISETDTELRIEVELPGINEKDVEVVLGHGRLTIKGEKKQQKEEQKKDYHMVERSYGSFARSIGLPFEADPNQVAAAFVRGVLTVTVPKPPEVKAKEKKIPVGKG